MTQRLMHAVLQALEKINIEEIPMRWDPGLISFQVSIAERDSIQVHIAFDEDQKLVEMFSYPGDKAPESLKTETILFCNEANLSSLLTLGRLEVLDDGQVRWCGSILWAEAEPNVDMLAALFDDGIQKADFFHLGISRVVRGEMSAQEAIEFCAEHLDAGEEDEVASDTSGDSDLNEV